MIVGSNHQGSQSVADEQALGAVLAQRDARGGAEFWLAERSGGFPCLALVVSGLVSHVSYFPAKGHPGFRCLRPTESEPLLAVDILFVWVGCDPASGEWVPNAFVVPFPTASAVAREFLRCPALPSSARWYEL